MSSGICLHSVIAMAYAASGLFFSCIYGMDFLCHRSSRRSRAVKSSLSLGSKSRCQRKDLCCSVLWSSIMYVYDNHP